MDDKELALDIINNSIYYLTDSIKEYSQQSRKGAYQANKEKQALKKVVSLIEEHWV